MPLLDLQALNGNARTNPATAEGNLDFNLDFRDAEGSMRSVSGLGATLTNVMSVRHTVAKSGIVDRRRSAVRWDQKFATVDHGTQNVAVYTVVDMPLATDITDAQVVSMLGRQGAFFLALDVCTDFISGKM